MTNQKMKDSDRFIKADLAEWLYNDMHPFFKECIPKNTINGLIVKESEKAYRIIWNYNYVPIWIPKSQLSNMVIQTVGDLREEIKEVLK